MLEIKRYILNQTGSKENINDGEKWNPKKEVDSEEPYKLYIGNSFNNISNYIIIIFQEKPYFVWEK